MHSELLSPKTKAARISAVAARFYRRAAGRLTKGEARDLGKRYGGDTHWRFMREMGDKLAGRPVGYAVALWADRFFREAFLRELRTPRRPWGFGGETVDRHMAFWFYWLGTGAKLWPGESLVFVPGQNGCAGGWRAQCAPDCACNECTRSRSTTPVAALQEAA